MTNVHIIRKQQLDVEVTGAECDALALQAELTRLSGQLMPIVERILDRCVPPERHVYIDRIDIDIGTVTIDSLEHVFAAEVGRALETSLNEYVRRPESAAPFRVERTAQTASVEALIYFLQSGTFPWSFRLPAGKALEQVIQDSWQEQSRSGTGPVSDKGALLRALSDAIARKRLVRQFSPAFVETLLSLISAEAKRTTDSISQTLNRAGTRVQHAAEFSRQLWEAAFARVAVGEPMTARDLVAAAWAALPAAIRSRELADILDSNWPQSTTGGSSPVGKDVHEQSTSSGPLGAGETVSPKAMLSDFSESARPEPVRPKRSTDDGNVHFLAVGPLVVDSPRSNANGRDSEGRDADRQTAQAGPPGPTQFEKAESTKVPAGEVAGGANGASHNPGVAPSGGWRGGVAKPVSDYDREPAQGAGSPSGSITYYEHPEAREGIYVDNAGLVLLHSFLPQFFAALGVYVDGNLVQRERALCLLHFLATGEERAPEYELVLAKILCNVPLREPVATDLDLTASEKTEAAALLEAVIRHWQALRNTSPDGLRSTFLLRAGKVSLREDGDWLLQVESKSFDILMDQLPWGISVIKLPWMENVLTVEWH